MDDVAVAQGGNSSVEVSVNAKGEESFKVKVYADQTDEQVTKAAEIAVAVMNRLRTHTI